MSLHRLSLFALLLAVASVMARADAEQPPDKALVLVRLPASAKLVFGSSSTEQTGPERLFVSPALTVGKRDSYEITAEWIEDGQSHTETQVVVVSPAAQTLVIFGAPKKGGQDKPADKPVVDKPGDRPAAARSRTFQFTYGAVVTGLKPEQAARIWLPVAPSNDDQEVSIRLQGAAGRGQDRPDAQYGNEIPLPRRQGGRRGQDPSQDRVQGRRAAR